MKTKMIYSAIVLAITSGCATQVEKLAWEVRPTVGVRHGMRSAEAHYQLGRYYKGQRRLRDAEREFQLALGEDDRHIGALNALGTLYASQGDLDKALATFRHVETLASDRAYLYNNLGFALMLQGKPEEALEQLKRAVTLDPGYERAWINLAEIAKTSGDEKLAYQVEQRKLAGPAGMPAATEQTAARTTVVEPEPAPVLAMSTTLAAAAPKSSAAIATPRVEATVARVEAAPVRVKTEAIASHDDVVRPVAIVASRGQNEALSHVATWSDTSAGTAHLAPIRTLELTLAARVDSTLDAKPKPIRLEVSNGNGIRRFAARFGTMLNGIGLPVSRITNHSTFLVEGTVIEYKPGFEAAAASLNKRLNLHAKLVERKVGALSSDVKVVLGRDLARSTAYLSRTLPP